MSSSSYMLHLPLPEPIEQPREPSTMIDFAELPETYGIDECEVLFRDPMNVFVYWEVTDIGFDRAREQLGAPADARLVMRLFSSTGRDRTIRDVDLPSRYGRRYVHLDRPGGHLRVAIGLLARDGFFASISHSSIIAVPPAAASPGPVEWMEVVGEGRRYRRAPLKLRRLGRSHRERTLTKAELQFFDAALFGNDGEHFGLGASGFLGSSGNVGGSGNLPPQKGVR